MCVKYCQSQSAAQAVSREYAICRVSATKYGSGQRFLIELIRCFLSREERFDLVVRISASDVFRAASGASHNHARPAVSYIIVQHFLVAFSGLAAVREFSSSLGFGV